MRVGEAESVLRGVCPSENPDGVFASAASFVRGLGAASSKWPLVALLLLGFLLGGCALGEGATGTPAGLDAVGTNSKGFPEFRNPRDDTVLVRIPGGTFQMGSNETDDERPVHPVTLPAYLIARVPVTNAQFARFVAATGQEAGASWRGYVAWRAYASMWGQQAPVVCVSWDDATAYATWAGLRLPTEEEWEFAARGPQALTYPWGSDWDPSRCRKSAGPGSEGVGPVGRFPAGASPFGCLDMVGSVWQWTASWHELYPGHPRRNPYSDYRHRVLRGGPSYTSEPAALRGAYRFGSFPADRCLCGFRVARSLVLVRPVEQPQSPEPPRGRP